MCYFSKGCTLLNSRRRSVIISTTIIFNTISIVIYVTFIVIDATCRS